MKKTIEILKIIGKILIQVIDFLLLLSSIIIGFVLYVLLILIGLVFVGSLIGSIIGVIIIKAANECFKSCDIEMLELYKRAKEEDVFLAWELAKNLFKNY